MELKELSKYLKNKKEKIDFCLVGEPIQSKQTGRNDENW